MCGSSNRPSPRASRSGDSAHAGYVAWAMPWHAVEKGEPLDEVLTLSRRYAAFARESRNDRCVETIRLDSSSWRA